MPQPRRDGRRRASQALEPTDVEERLVDREPFDEASSNTPNIALLASEYADMRGLTTTACGQSRRACRPPIAVRTPYAFAS